MSRDKRQGGQERTHTNEMWLKAWENRWLVYHIMEANFSEVFDYDEFLYDGLKGLCLAYERHDPKRGKFSACAGVNIYWYVKRAIDASRLPFHIRQDNLDVIKHHLSSTIRENEFWSWDYVPSDDDCEEDARAIEIGEMVESSLSSLPQKYIDVLRCRFGIGTGMHEMTLTEIAEELGIPMSTAKSRIERGLEMVKAHIEQSGQAERLKRMGLVA